MIFNDLPISELYTLIILHGIEKTSRIENMAIVIVEVAKTGSSFEYIEIERISGFASDSDV